MALTTNDGKRVIAVNVIENGHSTSPRELLMSEIEYAGVMLTGHTGIVCRGETLKVSQTYEIIRKLLVPYGDLVGCGNEVGRHTALAGFNTVYRYNYKQAETKEAVQPALSTFLRKNNNPAATTTNEQKDPEKMANETPTQKKLTIMEQVATIGGDVGQGAAQAGVNQVGDLMLDGIRVATKHNPMVEALLTDPNGREFMKFSMALALFLSAENAPGIVPKAPLISKAARYQLRHSSSFFTTEILHSMLPLLAKIADVAEKMPDIEEPKQIAAGSSASVENIADARHKATA